MKQPEYEWMPPFCLTCVIYFSWLGLVPIPFIVMNEIFPSKVNYNNTIPLLTLMTRFFPVADPTSLPCVGHFLHVDHFVRAGINIPDFLGDIWSCELYDHIGHNVCVKRTFLHVFHSWNQREVIWRNRRNYVYLNYCICNALFNIRSNIWSPQFTWLIQ